MNHMQLSPFDTTIRKSARRCHVGYHVGYLVEQFDEVQLRDSSVVNAFLNHRHNGIRFLKNLNI